MGNWHRALLLAVVFAVSVFVPVTAAHEQKTLTVILNDEGVVSGNITDPSFLQGNAVWFRMFDTTNNTTMNVRLDVNQDGVFNASDDFESGTLVSECDLDENGSLVDETCAVSALYAFDFNASVGTYQFWVHRNHNGSEVVWNHSIIVHKDVHEEEGPAPGDCFGIGCVEENAEEGDATTSSMNERSSIVLLAVLSLVGMVALTLSLLNEQKEDAVEKIYLEEE